MKLKKKIKNFLASWTFNAKWSNSLEPVIFLVFGGWTFVSGAEIATDMLYRKMCEVGMNHSQADCANLTQLDDLRANVTQEVNLFQLRGNLFKFIPPILISFIGGTLFDNFLKKIFLILPLAFATIDPIAEFFNFFMFYDLPVEFMYLTYGMWTLGGGGPMWYLAEYGYISLVAGPADRVGRLSRVDAMESLAPMMIIPLSAPVFHLVGYCGTHAIKLAMQCLGLLYLFFIIREPDICQKSKREKPTCQVIWKTILTSVYEMFKALVRPRKGKMRAFIFLQLVNFFILSTMMTGLFHLTYLYVKAVFNISGEEFANSYKEVETITIFLSQILLVPLVSKTLRISDSVFVSFVFLSSSVGLFVASGATSYTVFCIGRLSIFLYYSTWLLLRSLMVSCIDKDEIGRVFGAIAILGAFADYISDPIFRFIFDRSIKSFYPGFYIGVMAVLFLIMGINCIFLHFALMKEGVIKGWRQTPDEAGKEETGTEMETGDSTEMETGDSRSIP